MQPCWDPSAQWDPEVEDYLGAAMGADRLQTISQATVRPPLTACLRVNTLRSTPEDVLRDLPGAISEVDRSILADAATEPFIHAVIPFAVMVPGSGPATDIDYSVAEGKEVMVGRKCGESVLRGAHVFAPGVLACTAGIQAGDTVAVSVGIELPGSLLFGITRGSVVPQNLPLDDPRFPQRQRLFIGLGRAEVPRHRMNPSGKGLVLSMTERVFKTPAMGEVLKGQAMLQNLPSLVAALAVDPKPGSRVLDMHFKESAYGCARAAAVCAAPGGKTTVMAALMQNQGEIIALDRSHTKATNIEAMAEEMGATCITAYRADACQVVNDPLVPRKQAQAHVMSEKGLARKERIARAKKNRGEDPSSPRKVGTIPDGFPPESFDHVLLDAPCTALGLRPRLVLHQTLNELRRTAKYQRRLIDTAVRLVKPGGTLVFSTCTINPGENEGNVRYILDRYSCMKLAPQVPHLGGPGLTGSIPEGQLLTEEEAPLVQRFDPSGALDTIGFFISKFQKVSTSETEP